MNKLFYKHTKQSWKYKQYCLLLIETQLTDWSSKWQINYSDFWQLQSLASSINLSYMWSHAIHVIIAIMWSMRSRDDSLCDPRDGILQMIKNKVPESCSGLFGGRHPKVHLDWAPAEFTMIESPAERYNHYNQFGLFLIIGRSGFNATVLGCPAISYSRKRRFKAL